MEPRELIERLVPEVTRNATVVRIDEATSAYRVTIAGTTGVEERCDIPRDSARAAIDQDDARADVAARLKACADRTVAPVADGRG